MLGNHHHTHRATRLLCSAALGALVSTATPAVAGFDGVEHERLRAQGPAALQADLDGDGDGDIVLATEHWSNYLRFFRDDGAAGLTEITAAVRVPALVGGGFRLAAGDLDQDGDIDLIACSAEPARGVASTCHVLRNRWSEGGGLAFDDATDAAHFGVSHARALPLLADYDRDGDLDVIVHGWDPASRARLYRNDVDERRLRFTRLAANTLPSQGPARALAILDRDGHGTELYVSRALAHDQLLVLDADAGVYRDRTAARGLPTHFAAWHTVAVGDFDGNGQNDLVRHGGIFGPELWLQDDDGRFRDRTAAANGLGGAVLPVPALAVADFDRDGRSDLFVAGGWLSRPRLLLNLGPPAGGAVPRFRDAAAMAGLDERGPASATSVFLRAAECDWSVDLLVGVNEGGRNSFVHRLPADSARHTIVAVPGAPETLARFDGACVRGGTGPDRLFGHRHSSYLDGGGGDDVLVARAGLTVMRGGSGRDRFEAAGLTIVQLPAEDLVPGEVVDCRGASQVVVDSPLSEAELVARGVHFVGCFGDPVCEPDEHRGEDEDEHGLCHQDPDRLVVVDLGPRPPRGILDWGLHLDLVANYGQGFGDCASAAQCYAIGLDVCLTNTGAPGTRPQPGRCYPSDPDGLDGPVIEWCDDPFWARYRFDALQAILASQHRQLVVPIVFWLPRSAAVNADGSCSIAGAAAPMTIAQWHASVTSAAAGVIGLYGKFGVTIDYQFRTFVVPADSAFVADPDSDACRIDLSETDGADNSVGALVEANPTKYRLNELNIYLSDIGSGSGVSFSNPLGDELIPAIILKGTAGALGHELGHKLSLGHPYNKNVTASGEDDDAESRDSWLLRPFPDDAADRLHVCASDAQCTGVDAPPGACRKAGAAALGFCQNLKADCAGGGDRVCDTPWDALPCFGGVGTGLGDACDTDDDCNQGGIYRGVSYVTHCGGNGHCVHNPCTANSDCGGGSFCAAGYCVNWKTGVDACCDLHTDRGLGFDHNACFERRADDVVVAVPGVGPTTAWPIHDNLMAYHPARGQNRTLTPGQRDRIVCKLSYRTDLGNLLELPRPVGDPCSLRPGNNPASYGDPGESRLISHGSCASGVCQVSAGSGAVCVDSTCADGIIGAGEASVDCGGVCPNPCPTSRSQSPKASACFDDTDCASGLCSQGSCEATCADGVQNGSELGVDLGGASFDVGCAPQPTQALCRYEADCAPASTCETTANCVLSTDCPINQTEAPCTTAGDCINDGACVILERRCATPSCGADNQCPGSGICRLPEGRCVCAEDADCPLPGDSCTVAQSMCLDQCLDGRCLGVCELGVGGG